MSLFCVFLHLKVYTIIAIILLNRMGYLCSISSGIFLSTAAKTFRKGPIFFQALFFYRILTHVYVIQIHKLYFPVFVQRNGNHRVLLYLAGQYLL